MSPQKPVATSSEILDAMQGRKADFSEYYEDIDRIIIRGITLTENLVIEDVTCESNVSLVNCSLRAFIHIHGGTFKDFRVAGGRITKPIFVYGGKFDGSFVLQEIDALEMDWTYPASAVLPRI